MEQRGHAFVTAPVSAPEPVPRAVVAHPDPKCRTGIRAALTGEPSAAIVVAEAENMTEAVGMLAENEAEVLILDTELPGFTTGDIGSVLAVDHGRVAVIVLAMPRSATGVVELVEADVAAVLRRDCGPALLRVAVELADEVGVAVDPSLTPLLIERLRSCTCAGTRPFGLTARQAEIVALLPQGLSNAAIADRLGINQHTVKAHLRVAMRKMGVSRRGEAALVAMREGLAADPARSSSTVVDLTAG